MGESQIGHIGHQAVRKLPIAQLALALLDLSRPGTEMAFIDRDGRLAAIGRAAALHPIRILPFVPAGRCDDGGGPRGHFRLAGERIGLQRQQLPATAPDLVFIDLPGADSSCLTVAGCDLVGGIKIDDILPSGRPMPAVVPISRGSAKYDACRWELFRYGPIGTCFSQFDFDVAKVCLAILVCVKIVDAHSLVPPVQTLRAADHSRSRSLSW